jgi:hypothetical protein
MSTAGSRKGNWLWKRSVLNGLGKDFGKGTWLWNKVSAKRSWKDGAGKAIDFGKGQC